MSVCCVLCDECVLCADVNYICAAGEDNYARKSSCRRLSQVFTVVINITFLYMYYCFYLRHLATKKEIKRKR